MNNARKFLVAAVASVIGLAAFCSVIAPFGASAAVGTTDVSVAADRIGGAFATISAVEPDQAIVNAAARVAKGDLGLANCAGATWPNIDASCLTTADGSTAQPVRTITIGYQSDATTTVLVRIPTAEIAAR